MTAEETLNSHVGDTSDGFDTNYRADVIEAIEAHGKQSVQQCIDHIMNKVRVIEGANDRYSNAQAMILKTVAKELEAFL